MSLSTRLWTSSFWKQPAYPTRFTDLEALMPNPKTLLPDHQTYAEAVDAMRLYHEALGTGALTIEVERLRLISALTGNHSTACTPEICIYW